MKKTLFLVMALFVVSLLGNATQAYGMEMSADQKELWSNVPTYWELAKKRDKEGLKAIFSKDFVFWIHRYLQPQTRLSRANYIAYSSGTESYELKPFEVRITKNVGIVMYVYTYKDEGGADFRGRRTHIYMKQDGGWLFLGGMDASCKHPAPCP